MPHMLALPIKFTTQVIGPSTTLKFTFTKIDDRNYDLQISCKNNTIPDLETTKQITVTDTQAKEEWNLVMNGEGFTTLKEATW